MEYRKFFEKREEKKYSLSLLRSSFKILLNWRILNTFHMIMTHIDNEIRCKNCICNRHSWISIRHTSNLIVRMIQSGKNEVNEHHEMHINTFQMNVIFFSSIDLFRHAFPVVIRILIFLKYSEAIFSFIQIIHSFFLFESIQ